jgi:hypothetical protein
MKNGKAKYFRLEKLYLDCLDDRGNCFIIYRAELQLFFLKIHYSSLIFSDSTGTITEKSSLKKTGKPDSDDLLIFDNNILNISGSWQRHENPLPAFCFTDNKNSELVWNCHHPRALTEIAFNGDKFRGYGYGETLTLSIKPRNLPITELSWGRFLSEQYTIVWINWKGKHPVNKLYCNGIEYQDSTFEQERIIFGKGAHELLFKEISLIRKGKLSNLFSGTPWMKIFFNIRILNSLETKYKAISVLTINQEISSTGWSIYEIVTWKR